MAKLHELLAAVGSATDQAQKVVAELVTTFDKKRHHFGKKLVTFQSLEEGKPPVTEEQLEMQTTIRKELTWLTPMWARALDTQFQVNESNMAARADLILEDGTKLFEGLSATALLELEKRAGEVRAFVLQIPTLDPAKGFKPDEAAGDGVYRANEDKRVRTKKDIKVITLAQPTDKHPAQAQMVNIDVPTGELITQEWSGLITPAEKADLVARADELCRALKVARSRANEAPAATKVVGKRLLEYVFNGSK